MMPPSCQPPGSPGAPGPPTSPIVLSHNAVPLGCTVIDRLSMSERAAPMPVLARSLVLTCSVVTPVNPSGAAKVAPSSAALISAIVPVNVMMPSLVPLPVLKVNPLVPDRLTVPLAAVSVTWTGAPLASRSLTVIAVPVVDDSSNKPPCSMVCAPGSEFSGGASTASWKVSLTIEVPSLAVTLTSIMPTSPLAGVPENVRVAGSKFNQVGSRLLSSSDAV